MALRKMGSTLELELRFQEYIELVRQGTRESRYKAALYARKHFLSYMGSSTSSEWQDRHLGPYFERAMGLLAFQGPHELYHDLYNTKRWLALKEAFRQVALRVYHIPPLPLLHIALSVGLSSFKTLSCSTKIDLSHVRMKSHSLSRIEQLPPLTVTRPCLSYRGIVLHVKRTGWEHWPLSSH